MEGQTPK